MNVDALALATRELDETAFVARFPVPALIFRVVNAPAGPDLETDKHPLPGSPKARETMGSSFVLFLRSANGGPVVTVGRGREADVAIPLGNVSRIHAHFKQSGGAWTLTDNRSTNGTFLNDQKLATGASVEVPDGAWVRFGADALVKFFTPLGLFGYLKMYRANIGG